MTPVQLQPFTLDTQWHTRVWGGDRLAAPRNSTPIGEAWVVHDANRITSGPLAGLTLAEATERFGWSLLGNEAERRGDPAFPLLIKLLDTADWLSIQVHPDDHHAAALEGPGHRGKTEAWFILDATPDAELIAGVRPGVSAERLQAAIYDGTIESLLERHRVQAGDVVFIPAGAVHALGPGLLIYEVQQSSDLTYRVFDWNRPASAGRALHLEKSAAVARVDDEVACVPAPDIGHGQIAVLLQNPFFTLRLLAAAAHPLTLDPRGETFHAVTAIDDDLVVESGALSVNLARWESLLVPATAGPYRITAREPARALIASLV